MTKILSKADLHMHTTFSDGQAKVEDVINYVVNKTDLRIIAITDHNCITGALIAQDIVKEKKLPIEIIVGEEVSTRSGHVIGLFLKKEIPANLSVRETIKRIKKQNGLVIIPHPFYFTVINTSIKHEVMNGIGLREIMKNYKYIDAIETVDGTPTLADENLTAHIWNSTLIHKAETGSSDAHILNAIGMGYTIFEGTTGADLRHAIKTAQTRAVARRWGFLGLAKYAFFFFPKAIRFGIYTLIHGKNKVNKN